MVLHIVKIACLIFILVLEWKLCTQYSPTQSTLFFPFLPYLRVDQSHAFIVNFLFGMLLSGIIGNLVLVKSKKTLNKLSWDKDKADVTAQEYQEKIAILEDKIKTLEEALKASLKGT